MVRQGLEDVGHFPLPNLDLTECFFDFIAPLSSGMGSSRALLNFTERPLLFSDLSVRPEATFSLDARARYRLT
jgi:hypothetical protein